MGIGVEQRQMEGKTIDYIEGWFAISEANAIFGFDGWDRETGWRSQSVAT